MNGCGLIVPMRSEAFALLGRRGWWAAGGFLRRKLRLPDGTAVACICSGAGPESAEAAADRLLEIGVTRLVTAGTAGGLHPALRPGDLVVADRVFARRGERILLAGETVSPSPQRSAAGARIVHGALLTCGVVIETPAEKKRLYRRTGALAVDMESAGVVRAAVRRGVPCVMLRAVCDTAAEGLSREVLDTIDMQGRVHAFALARVLLRRPSLVPSLLRLHRSFQAAMKTLAKALPSVL